MNVKKTTQEPSHPLPINSLCPPSSPHGKTLPVAARPTQPLPPVTASFQTLNICQISSILYCKTEHPVQQNSKQRFIQFPTPWTDFSQKTCLTSTSFKTFHDGLNHVTISFCKKVAKEHLFISNSYNIFRVDSKGLVYITTTGWWEFKRQFSKVSICIFFLYLIYFF